MSEVSYRPVWLAADTADQVAAMKFWRDHDLVAGARDLSARAAQLCVLACVARAQTAEDIDGCMR